VETSPFLAGRPELWREILQTSHPSLGYKLERIIAMAGGVRVFELIANNIDNVIPIREHMYTRPMRMDSSVMMTFSSPDSPFECTLEQYLGSPRVDYMAAVTDCAVLTGASKVGSAVIRVTVDDDTVSINASSMGLQDGDPKHVEILAKYVVTGFVVWLPDPAKPKCHMPLNFLMFLIFRQLIRKSLRARMGLAAA
jgi:hypothetical protein